MTALATPFKNGEVDYEALKKMVRRQIEAGIHGLVPLGSTGEAATLNAKEREAVTRLVVKEAAGRVPVIVGASHNATAQAVEQVRQVKEWGADAALVVMPYYNKPTQQGGLAHFKAIAEAVDLPIVAYNVPGRTASNIGPELAEWLADTPGLVGIKEASADMIQVSEICRRTADKWSVLSGEDMLLLPFLACGGRGLISVTSNIAPAQMAAIYTKWEAGDIAGSRKAQLELMPLIRAMFTVSNPIPLKAALNLMGLCENELRLPLLPLEAAQIETLRASMRPYNLL
jgi:4-hydroxy-tetrahydrodipicolinate synthase